MARMNGRRREAHRLADGARAWAERQPDVVGLVLVGSCARGAARMSSDIDLLVLVDDPADRLADQRWLSDLVPHSRFVRRRQWGPVTELRRRTRSGLHVEIGVTDPTWAAQPLDAGTARVLADGAVTVHDPRELLTDALTVAQRGDPT